MVGKLVEGLFEELWTEKTLLDEAGLSTLFCNWGNPGIGLDFPGGIVAISVGPEGGDESWDEGIASTWESTKEFVIGMLSNDTLQLVFEFGDRSIGLRNLPRE